VWRECFNLHWSGSSENWTHLYILPSLSMLGGNEMKIKEQRTEVRRSFLISYEELCDKFPQLPKDADVYGCNWTNGRFGGWGTGNCAGIELTLDFDEMKDGSMKRKE